MGEFIFDHSWADFAERSLRISYYPKVRFSLSYHQSIVSMALQLYGMRVSLYFQWYEYHSWTIFIVYTQSFIDIHTYAYI